MTDETKESVGCASCQTEMCATCTKWVDNVSFGNQNKEKPLVDWGFSCGRHYLTVAGYIVAMEGDPIRDADVFALQDAASRKLGWKGWDGAAIKSVCAAAKKWKP